MTGPVSSPPPEPRGPYKVLHAVIWTYYDGPTVFVGTNADPDMSWQMVCGYMADEDEDRRRTYDVWTLPPDGSPPFQVSEDEVEWT